MNQGVIRLDSSCCQSDGHHRLPRTPEDLWSGGPSLTNQVWLQVVVVNFGSLGVR